MSERMSYSEINPPLINDIARLTSLRQKIAQLQQRITAVENLAAASAEHRLPFGLRLVASTGGAVTEVWRKNDVGEYAPYGYVNTAGVEYPFIADGLKIIKIGNNESALLTNDHYGIAITTYEVEETLRSDDINSEALYCDFEKFMEIYFLQDVNGKVASQQLFGSSETPQA